MEGRSSRFTLTLVVNHACNLRCTYCYTGAKFSRPMDLALGERAIARALATVEPGGCLDLGFFGGEPLLDADRILHWMSFARSQANSLGRNVLFTLTTNGTIDDDPAWEVMRSEDLRLTVSYDGLPSVHDSARRDVHQHPTSARVEQTLKALLRAGQFVRVNWVLQPQTVDRLCAGLVHLWDLGIRHVDLNLNLWTRWSVQDVARLENVIQEAAELWRGWLPDFSLNWFDGKVARLAKVALDRSPPECGFGAGEVAISPLGNVYPCERLVGEDGPQNPHRLPGNLMDDSSSLESPPKPFLLGNACSVCVLSASCSTRCRCSNLIRTSDPNRPDHLLCSVNKACAIEVQRQFSKDNPERSGSLSGIPQTSL